MPEIFYVYYPKQFKQSRPKSLPNWIKHSGAEL